MKIAMLGHKRIPSREGGIEVVVEELATGMVNRGHEVTCYNRKGHHVCGKEFNQNREGEYKGIKLKEVFTIKRRGLAAISSSVLATLKCAFGKYEVIHFHAEGTCVMLWFAKLMGKKCVVTVHGLDHMRAKWGKWARTYIKLGEVIAAKCADEIIVLSENVQRYFLETYNRKTVFIPNGVREMQHSDAEEITKKYGLKEGEYILFLARLVPEKGVEYLINAYRDVDTDKKLVIAGGTSDTDGYVKQLKGIAKGDSRIIFTGFVEGRILEELFSNAYVYVLPSEVEGMPLSLLEAMSYGNCCLVSDIPECMEVAEHKAVSFKCGDVNNLREKLQLLCDNEDVVRGYKKSSAEYINEKYNWDSVVEKTLRVYE